jgi:hypothetical protein
MKFGSSYGLRRPSKFPRSGCPSGERDHRVRGAGDREDANISRAVSGGHILEHHQFHISLLDQARQ